jgi:hypothetical protein
MNELDLVRGIAVDASEPDLATTQAARARLLAVIAAEVQAGQAQPTRRRPRRLAGRVRLRRLLPASVVVGAVLAVVLAAPLLLQRPATVTQVPGAAAPPGMMSGAEPTAVKVLTEAAMAAARAPMPEFGPGRYWYVLERGVKLGTNFDQAGSRKSFFYRFGYEEETWWALDGSISGRLRAGRARFLNDTERAAWVATGRPDLGLPNTEVYSPNAKQLVGGVGWLPPTYQDLVALPTDPARLLAALTERIRTYHPGAFSPASKHPQGQSQVLFGTISYLLEHYPLPPTLRAALYRVLTRLDGVKLVGGVTDLAGRRAVSVAIHVDQPLQERDELLLDPATGRLLGARSVLTRRVPGWRLPAGTVIDQRVFLGAAVVDSRTARPGAVTRAG